MSRIDLPGGWAELVGKGKTQERKRRRYLAAVADLSASYAELPQVPNPAFGEPGQVATVPDPKRMGSVQSELADKIGDLLILCFVREWSFGDVTEDAIADLEADTFDALFMACKERRAELMPDYSPVPDPKASIGESLQPHTTSPMERSTSMTPSSVAIS